MERYFCSKCNQDPFECNDTGCVKGLAVRKLKHDAGYDVQGVVAPQLTPKELQNYLTGLKFNLKRLVDDPDRDFPTALNVGWPNYCDVVSTFDYIELLIYRMDQFAREHNIDLEKSIDGSL